MKKVGQLMEEMGFNKNSPQGSQEAFLKYLIKTSTGVNVLTPTEAKCIKENPDKVKVVEFNNLAPVQKAQEPEQLVFPNFEKDEKVS